MSWFVNRSTMTKLILGFSILSILMVVGTRSYCPTLR